MNSTLIKEFVFKASKATYASGDNSIKHKELDGSTTISFKEGDYRYHDNYFGGEPYGGREVVFHQEKPVWMMVYYGFVHSTVPHNEVYVILMEALRNTTPEVPMRGPKLFEKENWKYESSLEGDFDSFSGVERIYKGTECVYEARYVGGLVDQV